MENALLISTACFSILLAIKIARSLFSILKQTRYFVEELRLVVALAILPLGIFLTVVKLFGFLG